MSDVCFNIRYLQAVVDSAEELPSVVGFLSRRRLLPPTNPLAADPRALLTQVSVCHACIYVSRVRERECVC